MSVQMSDIEDMKDRLDRSTPDWIQVKKSRGSMTIEFKAVMGATTSRSFTDIAELLTEDGRHIGHLISNVKQQLASTLNEFFVEKHKEFGVYGPEPRIPEKKAIGALRESLYSGAAQFVEGSVGSAHKGVSHSDAVKALETLKEYFDEEVA